MISILIADDHAIVRGGLRQIVAMTTDMNVVSEANNGKDMLEQLSRMEVDLLVMDMNMPGLSGIELIQQVHEPHPALAILVLSMHNEGQIVSRALRAGAAGYVTKDSSPEVLLAGIRKIAGGGRFIDPALVDSMVFGGGDPAEPDEVLSARELQVLTLIASGRPLGEIADQLHLSPKTVSTHKMRLMLKLGIDNNADLIRYASRHRLVAD